MNHDWKALEKLPATLETLSFNSENGIEVTPGLFSKAGLTSDEYYSNYPQKPFPMTSELTAALTVDLSHLVALSSASLIGGDFCTTEELAAGAAFSGMALVLPSSLRELTLGAPRCILGCQDHAMCEQLNAAIRKGADEEASAIRQQQHEALTSSECFGTKGGKPHPDRYGFGGGG